MQQLQTIYTLTTKCKNCYHCIMTCPVKAISVIGGQHMIEDRLCIKCGACVSGCPQHAKVVRSDVEVVKRLLASDNPVVASVDPSYVAFFRGRSYMFLPSALRMLGFAHVREAAEGAKYITDKSFESGQTGNVCTICAAFVNYAEKYKPDVRNNLIPVVSPMIAHGRMLKQDYPGCSVVYIGPCAAKKEEIQKSGNKDAVDCVITFTEFLSLMKDRGFILENCMASDFENKYEIGNARHFPVQGGMLKTAGLSEDENVRAYISLSGAESILDFFSEKELASKYRVIEPSFCNGGCIGSHEFMRTRNIFLRKARVIDNAKIYHPEETNKPDIPCETKFQNLNVVSNEVTAGQINKVFELTGKTEPEHRLNCGACGYRTCAAYAVAVVSGMAEIEMCIPYMRRLAQQRTDMIIETIPSGIVILDNELSIIKMNPAFQKMFRCNNGILGRRISYLVDADGYEALIAGTVELFEAMQTKHGVRYHEILYALKEEKQYVGIYVDVTKLEYNENQLDMVKRQTLKHAQEFLEHQVSFAQEMAHYLGKSTAKSEEIAKRLIGIYDSEGNNKK